MTLYHAYRLHAGELPGDPPVFLPHTEWCETPDPMRCALSREECLELIDWDRRPGERYRIRPATYEHLDD